MGYIDTINLIKNEEILKLVNNEDIISTVNHYLGANAILIIFGHGGLLLGMKNL